MTGVKHMNSQISKDYPHIDRITHESYWDMINFKDPCTQDSHGLCNMRNKYGHPCTRKVDHETLNIEHPDYVHHLSMVAERFSTGTLSPAGHHFESHDPSHHHLIMIDASKAMSLNDVLPTIEIFKEKEYSFLNTRYGAAFELVLRYCNVSYKLNSKDTFSLILFNTKKGINVLYENVNLKYYNSILDSLLINQKLDQKPQYSPVLETCMEIIAKYPEKSPIFLFFTSCFNTKSFFGVKSKSAHTLDNLKKAHLQKFKTEFIFKIIHLGIEPLSEEIRDLLITTKEKMIHHTSTQNALPQLIKEKSDQIDETVEGAVLTLTKSQIKMKKGTDEQERARLALEIFETELTYLVEVKKTLEIFYYPLTINGLMKSGEVDDTFSGLVNIHSLGIQILSKIEKRINKWYENPKIGDLFIDFSPFFKLYTTYIVKYEKSVQRILEYKDNDPKFTLFLELRRFDKYVTKGSTFSSYLILPIQRIPRYKLFVENILKLTHENHTDYKDLNSCLTDISLVADYLNEQINVKQKLIRMRLISTKLVETEDIIVRTRRFVADFRCQESTSLSTYDCILFLFNDILIHGLERIKIGEKNFQPVFEKKSLKEVFSEKVPNDIHFEVKHIFDLKNINLKDSSNNNLILCYKGNEILYSFESKEEKEKFVIFIEKLKK